MSELILTWLNDQVQLSKRVTSFQNDFTNGYLFGQILAKYNQQLNFSQFVNKDDKNSKLNNFTLLYQTFKSLRIAFDSIIVTDIMNQKQGVSKKILYELKMQLEKSSTNYFTKVNKSSTLTPLKKVQISKQKKDLVDLQFFKKRIQQNHRAQKNINQDNALKKFTDFHKTQIQKNKIESQKQFEQDILAKEALRNKLRNTLKRTSQFREEWERSNSQKWKQNIEIRTIQHQKDVLYQAKIQNSKKRNETIKEQLALKEVGNQIQEFQNKFLKKNGGQSSDDEKKDGKNVKNQLPHKTLNVSSTISATNIRIKKNPELEEIYRRQRDKRRRKMIVDQNKHQNIIQIQKRQQQILFSIQQISKQQKEIQYEIWRAWQNKLVILQNRKLRDSKYNQKKQIKDINNKFKDEQILKVFRQEHNDDIKQKMIRQNQLAIRNKVEARKETYNECNKMILSMLDITLKCFDNQQKSNKVNIEGEQLNQLISSFLEDKYSELQIAEIEMNNYLNGRQRWNLKIERNNNQPEDPEKQNAISNHSINNYYLGNILNHIFNQYYSPQIITNKPLNIQIGVCLLGLQFAGKKLIATQIAATYNLHIINIENLIKTKLQNIQKLKSQNLVSSTTGSELFEICSSGKQIPSQLLIQLIKQEIIKHPRFLLINYPQTYQQSILMTKSLTNIQPKDYIQKSNLEVKVYQFSRLAKPTETTYVQRFIRNCGIDLIVWIDINPQVSLDRCIGRRWVDQKIINIKQAVDVDPNKLHIKDRGASVVEKNNFKLKNGNDLKMWFKNFGIKVVNEHDSYQLISWQQIKGQKNQKQVFQDFENLFKQLLEYKKIYCQHEIKQKLKKQGEQKLKVQKLKLQEENKKKCKFTIQQQIQKQLNQALNKIQLNKNFIQNIVLLWNQIQKSTIQSYLKSFLEIRNQRQHNKIKISNLKKKFISQLVKPDHKFIIVKNFQLNYNQFLDSNKDMLQEDLTKQQLHQTIEDLQDKLLTIIQSKRQEAVDQRNHIINSGWLEAQLQIFYSIIQLLVINEIQRTIGCQQIITDFYQTVYSIQSKQITQSNNQLIIDSALQIISADNTDYPRLEKLFSQANRVFNRQQPEALIDDKNKKGGKAPIKKQDKKPAKKGGKQEIQQKKEITKEQLEMIAALNTQKTIFRYRINLLKQFSKRNIKKIKQNAMIFYNNLQEMLVYTNKVQIDAVRKLTKIFRDNIQKQQKIQNQIQINYIDIIISQKILNFEDPKPVILPARETIKPNRFSISQLKFLIQNIKNQSERIHSRIINRRLLTLLTRFTQNKQINENLPESWRNKTLFDYQHLISLLDPNNLGYSQLKDLFSLFILNDCRIISTDERVSYFKQLKKNSKEGMIDFNGFCKIKTWFQKEQNQKKIENVNTFNRSFHLKSLLFDIIKDQDKNQMNVDKYIRTISLECINKERTENMTYYELIFGK